MKVHQSLNDGWQFSQSDRNEFYPAEVPGCVHTDLLQHGLIPEPFWGRNELELQYLEDLDWTYRLEFEADPALFGEDFLELVAEGLDTVATVTLNGVVLGQEENMYIEHRYAVKEHLREGSNQLEITFQSPNTYIDAHWDGEPLMEMCQLKPGRSRIRKAAYSFGWDWGPRFPTSGIWRPIRLEAWSRDRLESVRMVQQHADGQVKLTFEPRLVNQSSAELKGTVSLAGEVVAEVIGNEAVIENPQLWWPNGYGEQPLYEVSLECVDTDAVVLGTWEKRIGLRTIKLDMHPDEWGECFQFLVNGKPIFAKGANWIPADAFPNRVERERYDNILTSAVEANMNMIRIWGGGIYEFEDFYDLCDEKGLLVWQDFMFACSLFRGDQPFLDSVRVEASQAVKRLAHRACLALWCGNNECEQKHVELMETEERMQSYEALFYKLLPEVVEELDGVTDYWPSSPHNPDGYQYGKDNPRAGDTHHWAVWHSRKPVKIYEEEVYRFYSEFGMQSFSSPEVAATFCNPEDMNIFGPVMENHQKNGSGGTSGNLVVFDYMARMYRFPKDYRATAYISQLNQAYCMKVAIEHMRRNQPRCMGALYWQLNDCWPVSSWSSVEFGGRWRALNHEARRFYAPAMLSLKVIGEEKIGQNNYYHNSMSGVEIFTVFDGLEEVSGTVNWFLETLDGQLVKKGSLDVTLRYGESIMQESLDFTEELASHGKTNLLLRAEMKAGDYPVSYKTALFSTPRFINLERAPIIANVTPVESGVYELELLTKSYHHMVQIDLPGIEFKCSDNYFDLHAGTSRVITLEIPSKPEASVVESSLTTYSLVDSYS
ncbi:beta-mannosidase [Coraliomargarita parva]|uniref:beta-mannosidase n=1 Tax=Coraliomargarita parva TaxID=3014050 RepID=UPI0022B4B846|nr:glycoside hydrolase family 2 protein [Coraliomargarita parva]